MSLIVLEERASCWLTRGIARLLRENLIPIDERALAQRAAAMSSAALAGHGLLALNWIWHYFRCVVPLCSLSSLTHRVGSCSIPRNYTIKS